MAVAIRQGPTLEGGFSYPASLFHHGRIANRATDHDQLCRISAMLLQAQIISAKKNQL
ncbi:hypothetical protein [Brucella anthropi]